MLLDSKMSRTAQQSNCKYTPYFTNRHILLEFLSKMGKIGTVLLMQFSFVVVDAFIVNMVLDSSVRVQLEGAWQ